MPRRELVNGVPRAPIQDRFGKDEASPWSYLWPLLRFVDCFGEVAVCPWPVAQNSTLCMSATFRTFCIFSACPAKRRGARLILDIHDIVPEFFASKFGPPPQSLLIAMGRDRFRRAFPTMSSWRTTFTQRIEAYLPIGSNPNGLSDTQL